MRHQSFVRRAGLLCMAGGLLQLLYGLLSVPFDFARDAAGWPEGLWALVTFCTSAGVLGLLASGVARTPRVAVLGATLVLLGGLIRIVIGVRYAVLPDSTGTNSLLTLLLLVSILLLLLGLLPLGVTTLRGGHVTGWRAWTPLLVWGYAFLPVGVYSISRFWHFLLLGLWGIPWLLLGYFVFTLAAPPVPAGHPPAGAIAVAKNERSFQ
ncbi:MAG: hypothetical protein M3014_07245 [Chloroflexota bacterium]|nr:hypothetical protein [Chloroflexota bacterium]